MSEIVYDHFDTRIVVKHGDSLVVSLPKEYCDKYHIQKGDRMTVLAKSGVFLIVSEELYNTTPVLRNQIAEFFMEKEGF